MPAEVIVNCDQPLVPAVNVWAAPERALSEVIAAAIPPTHDPRIEKQPLAKSQPLLAVEVAEVEVKLSLAAEIPHEKVEVAEDEETVIEPEVEALPERERSVAWRVPVANKPPTVEVPVVRELPWIARAVEVPALVVPIWKLPPVTYPP